MLRDQYQAALTMAERAKEFLEGTEFAGVLSRGKPEVSMFWQESGIWLKARADFLTDERDLILDYKSTGLPPAKWKRAIPENGYDTQSLLYQRGLSVLSGRGARFVFLVQETCAPYACWLVECSESMRELAGMKVARAIRTWGECLRTQRWPAYSTQVQHAEAPIWAFAEEEAMQ